MSNKTPLGRIAVAAGLLSMAAVAAPAADWRIETVDTSGVGESSSLGIDKDGNAHVCYISGPTKALKYGFRDAATRKWFTMVVDQSANACALALDSKQHPHISYADYGTGDGAKLRYAHWTGEWTKERLNLKSETIAAYSSIALDAEDRPTITFYEYRGPRGTNLKIRLRAVRWDGKAWGVETVDGREGSGKINTMTADANHHFHLAYANVGSGEMRYAFWNGNDWRLETVESREQSGQQYVGLSCGVAVDGQNNPHVVYLNATTMEMKYATRKGGRWVFQAVDRIAQMTEDFDRSSLAIDEKGRPFMGYYDAGAGVLKIAHQEGAKWVVEVVDGNGAGFTSSMRIDRGVLWVSYADHGNGALKFAYRELDGAGDQALQEKSAKADPQAAPQAAKVTGK